jgi:adenylate kinase family enzyme
VKVHNNNVKDVMGYYEDILVEIDGERSMDEVFASIDGVLSAMTLPVAASVASGN